MAETYPEFSGWFLDAHGVPERAHAPCFQVSMLLLRRTVCFRNVVLCMDFGSGCIISYFEGRFFYGLIGLQSVHPYYIVDT